MSLEFAGIAEISAEGECCLIGWLTTDIVDAGTDMDDIAGLTDGIGVAMETDDIPRPLDIGIPKVGVKLCEEDVGSSAVVGAAEVCIWLFTGRSGIGKLEVSPIDQPVDGCNCTPVEMDVDHPEF